LPAGEVDVVGFLFIDTAKLLKLNINKIINTNNFIKNSLTVAVKSYPLLVTNEKIKYQRVKLTIAKREKNAGKIKYLLKDNH
jgi:hypothetical protein